MYSDTKVTGKDATDTNIPADSTSPRPESTARLQDLAQILKTRSLYLATRAIQGICPPPLPATNLEACLGMGISINILFSICWDCGGHRAHVLWTKKILQ